MSILNVGPRLTETITVKRVTAHSSGGDPTRGTTFTCAARVERAAAEASISVGRDEVGESLVITETALVVGDLVFFSEDNTNDANTGHLVSAVATQRALDGRVTHYASSC